MNAMKCSLFVFVLYGIMLDSAFGEDRNIKLGDFKAKVWAKLITLYWFKHILLHNTSTRK